MNHLMRKWGLAAALLAAVFLRGAALGGSALGGAAFAGAPDGARIFELNEKLPPGMGIDAMRKLLGAPAEERPLKDKTTGVTRYMWLHGDLGIEVYGMNNAAYKVNILFPCGDARSTLRMLDDLTRRGKAKYGNTPSYDRATGQHFWLGQGIRFAFSKYNSTTVQSSCMKAE